MADPLDMEDMKRPRRRFSGVIEATLACPLCGIELTKLPDERSPGSASAGNRLIYRRNSVRIECGKCGVRFSVDPLQLADTIEASPELYGARDPWNDHPAKDAESLRALDSWNKALRPRRRFRERATGAQAGAHRPDRGGDPA